MISIMKQQVAFMAYNMTEDDAITAIDCALLQPYGKEMPTREQKCRRITKAMKLGHMSVLEHVNISLLIRTSIGTYKDYTRHRHCSFTIESTAYKAYDYLPIILADNENVDMHYWGTVEQKYKDMLAISKQAARDYLPQATAANMLMTTNIREWLNIIAIRGAKHENVLTRELRNKIWSSLHAHYPFFFEEVKE